jgi:hypothetical protein
MKTRTRDALIALRKLLGPDAVARG